TDTTAGIDQGQGVSSEDPANADVVGGALVAGKVNVPWAIFRAHEASGAKDQVFSRSFASGMWTTRGNGTVGGRSSGSPTFKGSLNFDQGQDGEAPAIDFAGTDRTVPWATWYEHTTGTNFGANNIFASRFDNSGGPNQGKWLFEGQGRGNGGSGPEVPSLNIHTNRDAENPVVAGGATTAGSAPVPWVTWQEADGSSATSPQQIFTSKAVKPTVAPTCPLDGTNPARPVSVTGAIATFCWQQVGLERLASGQATPPNNTTDPSMNVDPTRDGIEPDMAFTGNGDVVPWVVWYETSNAGTPHNSGLGLSNKEMVFAAKATGNTSADGQFQWTVVGLQQGNTRAGLQGLLDTTGTHSFGTCAVSLSNEQQCSINNDPTKDAEDPRVAAGTMDPTASTVPWVVWDEGDAANPNNNQVFVAHLTGAGPAQRFVVANGGQPVGTGDRADITFSGNTPYVTWHHDGAVVSGHFASVDHFVKDLSIGSSAPDSVRAPISSGCTANPFTTDGSACPGGAIGTPFFLFTNGTSPLSLLGEAYSPTPATGTASNITTTGATIAGNVTTNGAVTNVHFDYGTSTLYGSSTPVVRSVLDGSPQAFSAALTGLPANTTIHYRAVATSDFGTFTGSDQTFRTNANPPPPT
ncbi:MAG: hypothetical protein ACXVJY_19820, partial [Ilumatobacteraceae bacterium]